MYIKKAAVVACLALTVFLTGCSSISEGYITQKQYTPAHEGTWIWCHAVGKVTICQPMPIYYDDEWTFDIKKGKDKGYVDITEKEYDSYSVGDYYPSK
ncbi:MAG: hypothetical protein JWM52_313 [Candidatus Saccharibacteria bacterium]|nr:hypothetical protein [Candidatus Saccharibacteria bacterium]